MGLPQSSSASLRVSGEHSLMHVPRCLLPGNLRAKPRHDAPWQSLVEDLLRKGGRQTLDTSRTTSMGMGAEGPPVLSLVGSTGEQFL